MSITSKASTAWNGTLFEGSGEVTFNSSHLGTYPVNWKARSQGSDSVTTPEELIAAAHSSCFSMALSATLAENGTPADHLDVTAAVTLVPGTGITTSKLTVRATVPGLDAESFAKIAAGAKEGCPVSQALAGIEITLDAALV